jgi:hypothetical protein
MIAIKNMEMPKSCKECPMTYKDEVDYRICTIIGKNVDYGRANEIHSDCPIVEIVTCKDCKHWDKDITPRVPDTKEYHFCPMMDCNTAEDFFCGDGKRRE